MTITGALRATAAALAVAMTLSGCKSDDARLDEYLSSGQAFAAQGDYPRAIIQFRNALKIDPDHAETRAEIGRVYLTQGALREAQQEFVLLSERFPETLEFRSKLGEIALVRADWQALERQAAAAIGIDAEALDARALDLASRYREASKMTDPAGRDALAAEARELLEQTPAHPVLLRIAVDHATRGETPADALPLLDAALAADPHAPEYQLLRIRLLAEDDRLDAAEARLFELAALYPDDPQIAGVLVARHMSTGRIDEAEAVLRALAEGAPAGDTVMRSVLVQFLQRTRGPEAARAELARLIAQSGEGSARMLFTAMDRSIRFDQGDHDGAVESLRALLEKAEPNAESHVLRVLLAEMLDRLGNRAEARGEIASVLARDPGHPGALKLRASWAIEEEKPKDAIVDLRTALSQRPRDTELMTLLAAAHAQDGTRGLALEQLSAAAQASGHSARETERYARALLAEGRPSVARRVLDIAHEAAPGDLGLALMLAEVQIEMRDWASATRLLAALRRYDRPEAETALQTLEAHLLIAQGQTERAGVATDRMLDADPGRQLAFGRLIEGLMRRGEANAARTHLDLALARRPNDLGLRLLDADLRAARGDVDAAEASYRELMVAPDVSDAPALHLFELLVRQNRRADADAALAEGLEAHPGSRPLRMIESSRLAATGDAAGAIALLEVLHDEMPGDAVAANNLASLLSSQTDDPATLARAARIVAPLRSSANPAVSDTIGWIAFRRGDGQTALPLMRRAARGLPGDAGVLLRLGQVEAALGHEAEARKSFAAVIDLADADHPVAIDAAARLQALGG